MRRACSLWLGMGLVAVACATKTPNPNAVSQPPAVSAAVYTESEPEYWLSRLSDPAMRPAAMERLIRFYEEALTAANGDAKAEAPRKVVDKTVLPLTKTYVEVTALERQSRVALLRLLAAYQDARAEPAFREALTRFAKAPSADPRDEDIRWAAQAAVVLRLESLSGPLLEAFRAVRASTELGAVVHEPVRDAMLALASKSWVLPLVGTLQADVTLPRGKSAEDAAAYKDRSFWQLTAAEVLGRIGDPRAVEPLIRVVIDSEKSDLQRTARASLLRIGKPASDGALALLSGQNRALRNDCVQRKSMPQVEAEACGTATALAMLSGMTEFRDHVCRRPNQSVSEWAGEACDQLAGGIVSTIGHRTALQPTIARLKSETKGPARMLIAADLPKFPPTPEGIAAFKEAYESLSVDPAALPGVVGLRMLADAAGQFFDPNLVGWLLDRATLTKVPLAKRETFRLIVLLVAIKLARPDQLAAVQRAVAAYGGTTERAHLAVATRVLRECAERADCYVATLTRPENQSAGTSLAAIKSAYMAAIFGDQRTRDQIIDGLDSIRNAEARSIAVKAIDHLSPQGSPETAERLRALVERNANDADRDRASRDEPLKQLVLRLASRQH